MEIKITEAKIEGNFVSALATFHSTLVEIEALGQVDGYSAKTEMAEKVVEKIADRIAEEYITANKSAIMENIDIDKIVKGVQLKVVEGFSLQR